MTQPSFNDKTEARRYFAGIRKGITGDEKLKLDNCLTCIITSLPEYKSSDLILLYYPIKSEPDLRILASRVISDNKRLAFPVSLKDDCKLLFKETHDLSDFIQGEYGIPEPSGTDISSYEMNNSICIVPALSFDKNGYRIGYGGGYYDRFLNNFQGISIGLIYSDLLADTLPIDQYDIPVDIVITEKGEAYRNEGKDKKGQERQKASLYKSH